MRAGSKSFIRIRVEYTGYPKGVSAAAGSGCRRDNSRVREIVRFLTICGPFDALPDFPCKPTPRLPFRQTNRRKAVKTEVSNNEGTDTWGLPGQSRPKAQRGQSQHRLLGDSNPTCGPFAATPGLGFTGFFFPLLKPMLGMGGHPAIRQQGLQGSRVAGGNGRNPTQHVGQIRPHVHAVPPGTLHQRIERRRRLAAMLASEKQVILADRSRPASQLLNQVVHHPDELQAVRRVPR